MISSQIINNEECRFKSNDELLFDLRWKSYKTVDNIRLRAEVLYSDNTPAGTSFSFAITNINKDEEYIDRFKLNISRLAPGRYTVVFVLFEVNELGIFSDMDRVEHGLNFEIIDNDLLSKVIEEIKDVAGNGRTVLYVSHSMRTVQQLCNRVIVMDHGKIIFDL